MSLVSLRTVVTHRCIHSLLQARLSWNSSLQFVIVDSECRVVDMDIYSKTVCTKIAIAGIFIIGIIVVFGIIGNSLTFVVFWKGNFKSSTSFLFLSLSLIDSAVLLTVFTCYIVQLDYNIGWLSRDLLIYLEVCAYPVSCTAETATIWVTVLIAVNRYIIVCLPLRASQWCTLSKVKIQLAVVLLLAVLYNIPEIVRYRVVHISRNNGTSYVAHVELMGPQSFPQLYDESLSLIVLVCLPLFILTLLTIRLINAMKVHRRMQANMQRQHIQPDSSMTFALVIVVIVFIICRAPLLVWSVMSLQEWLTSRARCYMDLMYYTFIALNSSVNFVIYILINRRFRNVLFANVCGRRSAIPVGTANMITMTEIVTRETADDTATRRYVCQYVLTG